MEREFSFKQEENSPAEINLCIFPHLKQLIVVDLRTKKPTTVVLDASQVFDEAFFKRLEEGFAELLRESTEHPVLHLMTLSTRVEELIRETSLLAILERISPAMSEGEFPRVAVLIVSGSALALNESQLTTALVSLFGDGAAEGEIAQCVDMVKRLMAQEREEMKRLEREDLKEALQDQSQHYFTLWENRN